MFSALALFFKNKVFSLSGSFILIFMAIFALFLFSNTNTILSKFGFETTTNLKAELVKSQEDLKKLAEINTNLNNLIVQTNERHKRELEAIRSVEEEKKVIDKAITEVVEIRKVLAKPVQKKLIQKTVTTETTITIPIEEYNQLSEQNIDSIHAAFAELEIENLNS